MSNFIHVTPFMHVDNLDRALTFFTDILGFETPFRVADYAYVQRETVGFRILQQTGDDGAPPGNRRFAYYIDVRDVDQLYAELKPKLDKLPKGDVYGPVDQSYGQHELLVLPLMATCWPLGKRLLSESPGQEFGLTRQQNSPALRVAHFSGVYSPR